MAKLSVKKAITTGQVIRRIQAGEFSGVYSLFGNDSFLQDFIMTELEKKFLESDGGKFHYSLGDDNESELFGELSSYSLFEEKRMFIIRQVQRLSKDGRKTLEEYIQSPNSNNCVVIISEEYNTQKSMLKMLASTTDLVDVRPPFANKMGEWVNYVCKVRGYKISSNIIHEFMQQFGDSISNVINEIEKAQMMVGLENTIDKNSLESISFWNRGYQAWNLQDSLGKRDLESSMKVFHSLLENGTPLTSIVISIFNLFQLILWKLMGHNSRRSWMVNAIIQRNLDSYSRKYSIDEIKDIICDLRKADLLKKSTSISEMSIIQPMIVKICKGLYV